MPDLRLGQVLSSDHLPNTLTWTANHKLCHFHKNKGSQVGDHSAQSNATEDALETAG